MTLTVRRKKPALYPVLQENANKINEVRNILCCLVKKKLKPLLILHKNSRPCLFCIKTQAFANFA